MRLLNRTGLYFSDSARVAVDSVLKEIDEAKSQS